MVTLSDESTGGYTRSLMADEFNGEALERARIIFNEYKARGILLNRSFDDDTWRITDEKHTATLMRFDGSDGNIAPWIGCTMPEFRKYVKVFLAFKLGDLSMAFLQEIAKYLLSITGMDEADMNTPTDYSIHVAEFLQLLPGGCAERDRVIELLSEHNLIIWGNGKNIQRILSDFYSYLRFGDAITDFWASATDNEKLFYFPLYFWWNLTAILPLRVTEFLLTPRNCIEARNGRYFLTIRRSKLKGGGRKIGYRISDDYELKTYELSANLAQETYAYIDATKDIAKTELDTLFVTRPHYNYRGINAVAWGRRYYTYSNLSMCMQYFMRDVIGGYDKGIGPIRLGDTRHIAMVNLIISGGSPVICRELAGHADIAISSHYYSNISNLVECATIKRLRKAKGGADADIIGEHKYTLSKTKYKYRVNGGYCDSAMFGGRNASDCLHAVGVNGELGYCAACAHYLPDIQGPQLELSDDKAAKAAVDADSRYLMQMVELVRKGLGHQEDIRTALLRLQHSANIYSAKLQEKFDYGTT